MRKHQQKLILELIGTLREAAAETRRLFVNKDFPTIVQILANCQESAAEIGNYIESIEGEGTKTVSMLEEYCDTLYQISVDVETSGTGSIKRLDKHLILIGNNVRNELQPNKTEIAFISYKASMSDSIESIYLAAKEDPQCDAYWIPIPYFDRKPDGDVGEMHFEGADCYGDNIEVTDWQSYDIEARRPDVIFTFNPYDLGNFVTSVHPDYYCERLRNLTDLLVYVPYFVVVDVVIDHFCNVAGCVYAHKVIVQSELARETYIRVLKENYGSIVRKPEEKVIALGSPKFDKVVNTKREDCELPDEWKKLIDEKKVVFWNTTVGMILQGNEQYLKKLRYVIDTFRERNDIVLWWRPHPLNEAAFLSMRPQLFREYEQIVADYKSGGWGIYDDTPDLHRAIAWTDVYYGDGSSLVAMYQKTGKPVIIQSLDITGDTGKSTDAQRMRGSLSEWLFTLTGDSYGTESMDFTLVDLLDELSYVSIPDYKHKGGDPGVAGKTIYEFVKTEVYLIEKGNNIWHI